MADQRKLNQNIGLENINMTSNYDVTNNAHQIQMTPYATEWKPPMKVFCVRHSRRWWLEDDSFLPSLAPSARYWNKLELIKEIIGASLASRRRKQRSTWVRVTLFRTGFGQFSFNMYTWVLTPPMICVATRNKPQITLSWNAPNTCLLMGRMIWRFLMTKP